VIGVGLRFRKIERRRTEVGVPVNVLNRMKVQAPGSISSRK
jgi:hypothetical protein